jgi:serine/threonine protein kinase
MTVEKQVDSRVLQIGSYIGDYQVEGVLGQGTFGITYLAIDKNLQIKVAIKEYFPREYSIRQDKKLVQPTGSKEDQEFFEWGLDRFLSEARILARLNHPNIVAVRRLLESNHTAYLVMDYCEGRPLDEIIESDGPLAKNAFNKIVWALLDALEHVHHAGLIHRDVKPANVFVRADGSPVLLDFGAARNDISRHSKSVTSLATAGYAPLEQYDTRGNQGPWSDIYGLSATLYRSLTGIRPPDAAGRVLRDDLVPIRRLLIGKFDDEILIAIDKGLEVMPDQRPNSIADWRKYFVGGVAEIEDLVRPAVKSYSTNSEFGYRKFGSLPRRFSLLAFTGVCFLGGLLLLLLGERFTPDQKSAMKPAPEPIQIPVVAENNVDSGSISFNEDPSQTDQKSRSGPEERDEQGHRNDFFGENTGGTGKDLCVGSDRSKWDKCIGVIKDANGVVIFKGEMRFGLANGKGEINYVDLGDRYVGDFKNDYHDGKGIYYYKDGTILDGNFFQGKKSGVGKTTFNNGDVMTCQYKNGLREGLCKYKYKDGLVVETVYKSDEATNPQKLKFPSGDSFVGDIIDDKYNGKGTYTFASGTKYVGEYRDGKRNGTGTEYDANGAVIRTGQWRDGELLSAEPEKLSGYVNDSKPKAFGKTAKAIAPRAQDAGTMRLCKDAVAHVKKTLPYKLDTVTVLFDATCIQTDRGITFIYKNEINTPFDFNDLAMSEIHGNLKDKILKEWCNSDQLRPLLKSWDVEYHYFDEYKKFKMAVGINSGDCN